MREVSQTGDNSIFAYRTGKKAESNYCHVKVKLYQ